MSLKTFRSNWGVAAAFLVVILSLVDMPSGAAQPLCNCIPDTIEFELNSELENQEMPEIGINSAVFSGTLLPGCDELQDGLVTAHIFYMGGDIVEQLSADDGVYTLSIYNILEGRLGFLPLVEELKITIDLTKTTCEAIQVVSIEFSSECEQFISFDPTDAVPDGYGIGVIQFTDSDETCFDVPPSTPVAEPTMAPVPAPVAEPTMAPVPAPVAVPTTMAPVPAPVAVPAPVDPPSDPPSKAGKAGKGTRTPGKGKGKGGSKNPKSSNSPGKGKGGSKTPKSSKSKAGSKTPKSSK